MLTGGAAPQQLSQFIQLPQLLLQFTRNSVNVDTVLVARVAESGAVGALSRTLTVIAVLATTAVGTVVAIGAALAVGALWGSGHFKSASEQEESRKQ
ncbi:hypothetical protein PG996_009804 [Apiospora saccharicola]|uniref:Uncharacterized protein n=1 Tax=Apiospora saccharicola TaxID=335842 RepID=A0ABR1ULU2_9PEZI